MVAGHAEADQRGGEGQQQGGARRDEQKPGRRRGDHAKMGPALPDAQAAGCHASDMLEQESADQKRRRDKRANHQTVARREDHRKLLPQDRRAALRTAVQWVSHTAPPNSSNNVLNNIITIRASP